jgi:hypothetical protein
MIREKKNRKNEDEKNGLLNNLFKNNKDEPLQKLLETTKEKITLQGK